MDPNDHHPAVPTSSATIVQCDECGAPVDEEQRYCVECGAHRRHVADPVARYLSQASARSRTTRVAATTRRTPGSATSGRARGLGIALALALIPAAAAVGVLAGRSSNNDDSTLINALAREQTAASHLAASGGVSPSTAPAASVPHHGGSTSSAGAKASGSKSKPKSKSGSHTRHHAAKTKAASTGPTVISTAPATAAQKQTGAQDTQKVQKSKGKTYVHQQSKLPATVVVP